MHKKVLIFDTSVLCCWLRVAGKDTAGTGADKWDFDRIDALIKDERVLGSTFVLPIASLIETGNHVAQSPSLRYEKAIELAAHLVDAADSNSPWAAFTEQADLWSTENLRELASSWPTLAAAGLTIGDATIKKVAHHYASAGFHVEILTGDDGLKAYEPLKPVLEPRRRR